MNKTVLTSDGSHTLFNPEVGEHYHSSFGAITESVHIFIRAGLDRFLSGKHTIRILEIGLGTGLNALLALQWAEKNARHLDYFAVEAYPLEKKIVAQLNHAELLGLNPQLLTAIHEAKQEKTPITDVFSFNFLHATLQDAHFSDNYFDMVFFDAFSPDVQPEMWTESCFQKIAKSMKGGAVLTTYSCKGTVKRALKAAGFLIEKLPGPPGKREFLRAVKAELNPGPESRT